MSETRREILALAEELIRTKGYHAFSYKDISRPLDIKNAAVHYHFPAKTDLGVAVIEETIERFKKFVNSIQKLPENEQLEQYIQVYTSSQKKGWVCITGALSPVFQTLPEPMQRKMKGLATAILSWLTVCLEEGRKKNLFHFRESAETKAQLVISNLMASLLLGNLMGEDFGFSIQKAVMKGV